MHKTMYASTMQVFHGISQMEQVFPASVVTIGNFDGVHRGHQQLLETVRREALAEGVAGVVYTFNPHPVKVLYPEKKTERMFDLKDQQEQFHKFGMKAVIVEPFTASFAKTSATVFIKEHIIEKLHPLTIVVGHDFSFGSSREGNLHFLEQTCREQGIKLIIVPPYRDGERPVSSSWIRESLKAGDVDTAAHLLARRYYVRGHVEQGFQRGRTIGVPTANITPDVEFVPRLGVYCTLTKVRDHYYPSITNIGVNPTFAEQGKVSAVKIESHLFDFDAQIYGEEVEVVLRHFIRDEKRFSGIDELKSQIQKDIQFAKDWFLKNA